MTTIGVNIYRCTSISQAAVTFVLTGDEHLDLGQRLQRNEIVLKALLRSGFFGRSAAVNNFIAAVYNDFEEPAVLEQKLRQVFAGVEVNLDVTHHDVTDAEYREAFRPPKQ